MLLFLTAELFTECISAHHLSQGREKHRRWETGGISSHREKMSIWCGWAVGYLQAHNWKPSLLVVLGDGDNARNCLHYFLNAGSPSQVAKFPLSLHLIKKYFSQQAADVQLKNIHESVLQSPECFYPVLDLQVMGTARLLWLVHTMYVSRQRAECRES